MQIDTALQEENYGIPDEFLAETPDEEILYDWDGGVMDEAEQDA